MQMTSNTVLVTFGGTGIGRGFAEAFHRAGSTVVIADRRQARLDEVAAGCPGIRSHRIDLTDAAAILRFAEDLVRQNPALNVLVNNDGLTVTHTLG